MADIGIRVSNGRGCNGFVGSIAEIYDPNGLFPWYLKAKIQKVLFGPEPQSPKLLGGAISDQNEGFCNLK